MSLSDNDKRKSASSRILIVDDNEHAAVFISDLLKDAGYTPLKCMSGHDALECIKQEEIELVLLDVVMPDINGITLAAQMKTIAGPYDFLPIILVTALSNEEDIIAGLAHADDYITKPFSGEELLARIKSLLRIRRLHHELAQSKNRYQSLYENAPHMYLSINSRNEITDCNQLFCRIFGISGQEVIGNNILSLVNDEDRPALEHFLGSLSSVEPHVQQAVFPIRVRNATEPLMVDMKAVYIGEKEPEVSVVIAMEDVTKRIRLEEEQKMARRQLYRSARLASIGTLASGVAHEMNNPLTAILGFSSALIDRFNNREQIDLDEIRQYLQIINSEAIRCRDIVENLSKFAREREYATRSISLLDCVNDALKLISSKLARAGITIENRMTADVQVKADSSRLEQVLVNILSNCVDFCPPDSSVTIELDDEGWERMKYVTLSITDNGPGIAPDVVPKVFDPFFTTKEVGKGTGMGLSICHKIMEESNGNIDINSEPGKGTTVLLEIPKE